MELAKAEAAYSLLMILQCLEVVKRADARLLACIDEAHEHVTNGGAVLRFEKQRVFPVEYGLLQGTFTCKYSVIQSFGML